MKKHILVIEDDLAILDTIKLLLELEDFDVTCAKNGQEGIDLLKSLSSLPNLILLDLMMPVKDGFEFRKDQLNDLRLAAIPVVVITAEGTRSERKDRLNASDFIKKPFDADQLAKVLRHWCS